MKNVSVFYLICILLGVSSLANAQSASKCFRADWLQGERVINMTISGSDVTGTFTVGGDADQTRHDSTYKFRGKLIGNSLRVAFAGNKLPNLAPAEMKSLIWTLEKSGNKESLRIQLSGKNYETNKYEVRFAYFEACDAAAGYAALAKTAQRIRFAKGESAASMGLAHLSEFQAMRSPATFLISAAKSQSLEIEADGCTIEVYLPDKKVYEFVEWKNEAGSEKTSTSSKLDRMLIESLPQTGTYLIVLRKPHEAMRPETITFKATTQRR